MVKPPPSHDSQIPTRPLGWPTREPHHLVPDLVLLGAAKSGTTSLAAWMGQHPQIRGSTFREPCFFSDEDRFERGFDWYTSLFEAGHADQLVFDASTNYSRWPRAPLAAPRLHFYSPHAKLIYMMRHPVDRAYSHFVHRWTKETHIGEPFRMSFDEFVEQDSICLDESDYQMQLERYLEFYPADAILCLFTDSFRRDPVGTAREVCRFARIDDRPSHFASPTERRNVSQEYLESRIRIQLTNRIKSIPLLGRLPYLFPKSVRNRGYELLRRSRLVAKDEQSFTPPPMTPNTRQWLLERFAPVTEWVEAFTQRDLSSWRV